MRASRSRSVTAAIEAQRDFWIAETNLQTALDRPLARRGAPRRLTPPAPGRSRSGTLNSDTTMSRIAETSSAAQAPPCSAPRAVSRAGAASLPEAVVADVGAAMRRRSPPPNGRPYNPVVTLNGWTLPWRMKDGVKEFHLVAEPVVREIAPGMKANLWGYNGQSPGPTIEVVEGDRVRIFVTNKLPEHTSIHWHGIRCPTAWTA